VVLTTQFWILVNDVFNPREAKRLIGFFGSGGILGGVAGGVLTGFAARGMEPHDLLLFSAVFLLGALAVVAALFSGRGPSRAAAGAVPRPEAPPSSAGPSKVGFWDCARSVRKSRYLMLIAAVVMVTGIVSTFIDWQSKTIIYQKVDQANLNLTSFFGFFNSGLLAFAFLFQLVLTSRFIERFGIRLGLMIYPAVLLAMSLGIAVRPDLLWLALGIKGSDKALSYSLNQSARELLYIPVVPELKYRAKIFIDMFLNRFSKAVGGLVLIVLILVSVGKFGALSDNETGRILTAASAVSVGFLIFWMVLNTLLDKAYVREVRLQLAKKWERPDTFVSERMDVETAKLIVDALESRTQSPTLFALNLYDLARRRKLTPEIKCLLAPQPETLASPSRSSPLMESGEAIWMPDADDPVLSADVSMDTEIRKILALDSYQKLMGEYAGRILDGPARPGGGNETARMELAKAIGLMDRGSPLSGRLGDFLGDPSPAVFQFAAESAGRLRDREFVTLLVRRLADPMSRGDARSALEKYGDAIVGTLSDFLADRDEGAGVRGPAASLLAGIGTSEAAEALLEELDRGPSGTDEDIIDALDRIRSRNPELAFPADTVRARLASALTGAGPVTGAADLLPVFRLLGLIHDHEDIFRAYQNLLKGTKDSIGYAIELLDHTLDPETKSRLFPRLDDLAGGGAAPDPA